MAHGAWGHGCVHRKATASGSHGWHTRGGIPSAATVVVRGRRHYESCGRRAVDGKRQPGGVYPSRIRDGDPRQVEETSEIVARVEQRRSSVRRAIGPQLLAPLVGEGLRGPASDEDAQGREGGARTLHHVTCRDGGRGRSRCTAPMISIPKERDERVVPSRVEWTSRSIGRSSTRWASI